MTDTVLIGACCVVFGFNLWAISRGWLADFGRVTRGELAIHAVFAAVLPAGFMLALISLANSKWPNAWSRFWNKDALSKTQKDRP